jgi:hypothetical protein
VVDHATGTTEPHAAKTPAQMVEAPPTTGAHPTVAARLVEQIDDLNLIAETADAATFATDAMWDATGRLSVTLEKVRAEAARLRPEPAVYPRF